MKTLQIIVSLFFLNFNINATDLFSANDLAVLVPLKNNFKAESDFNLVRSGITFLTKQQFEDIIAGARSESVFWGESLRKMNTWHMVGFRYSPCIYIKADPLPCKEQLRVIFQPAYGSIADGEFNYGYEDRTIHFVATFNETGTPQNSDLLKSFFELKKLSGGLTINKPNQPSPVLADSIYAPKYRLKILEIFRTFLPLAKNKKVTVMGLGAEKDKSGEIFENSHKWIFLTGDLVNGRWIKTKLPFGVKETSEFFTQSEDGIFSQLAGRNDFEYNFFIAEQNDLKIAFNISSPLLANDKNTNCVSCHASERAFKSRETIENSSLHYEIARMYLSTNFGVKRLSEILVPNQYSQAMGFSDTTNLRLFGYLAFQPTIGQRLVNDNAKAVADANNIYGFSENEICNSEKQKITAIQCVLFGDFAADISGCIQSSCVK